MLFAGALCPVAVSQFSRSSQPRTMHVFRLASAAGRVPSGDIAVDSDRGWFKVAFPAGTAVVRARFAQPLTIRNAWVEQAGGRPCAPLQPGQNPANNSEPPAEAAGATTVRAAIMAPYGRTGCADPFAPVRAVEIVEPQFPPTRATFGGVAVIDVTIALDASVAATDIVQRSGTPAFDDAAADAAKHSKYAAGLAYCMAAAAHYRYTARLEPNP